jgi:hypothetical protein
VKSFAINSPRAEIRHATFQDAMNKLRNNVSRNRSYVGCYKKPKSSRRNVERGRPTQRRRLNYAEMILCGHSKRL